VVEGEARLNKIGSIVFETWQKMGIHFPGMLLDEFVVMPNHLHCILFIVYSRGEAFAKVNKGNSDSELSSINGSPRSDTANASPLPAKGTVPDSLAAIIQNYKSVSTRKINKMMSNPGGKVWQRNYYEHVIRNEDETARIRKYIRENPLRWETDEENPRFNK
jgi:REP-associated tyrosine transposase